MTKTVLKIIIFAFLLNGCSGQTGSNDTSSNDIIEKALTFELSFGADERTTQAEFLLAEPLGIAVNDAGDIYVFDELSIKVYDSSGRDKLMLGGPGEGPGEFEYLGGSIPFIISNDGILTVTDSKGSKFFSQDNKYVDIFTINNNEIYNNWIKENDFFGLSETKGLYLDKSKKIIEASVRIRQQSTEFPYYSLLLFEYDNQFYEIAKYRMINRLQLILKTENNLALPISIILPFRGELEWGLTNSGEIVFSHPGHDNVRTGESNSYTIHVFDPSDLNTRMIERLYEPVLLADSVLVNIDKSIMNISNRFSVVSKKIAEEAIDRLHDTLEDNIYYAPFQKLITDGNAIYVVTYDYKESNGFLTDIFDVISREYLRSAYFSIIPLTIKNGFAYRLSKSSDGFDIVEKYKIDPAVYRK